MKSWLLGPGLCVRFVIYTCARGGQGWPLHLSLAPYGPQMGDSYWFLAGNRRDIQLFITLIHHHQFINPKDQWLLFPSPLSPLWEWEWEIYTVSDAHEHGGSGPSASRQCQEWSPLRFECEDAACFLPLLFFIIVPASSYISSLLLGLVVEVSLLLNIANLSYVGNVTTIHYCSNVWDR